MNFLRKLILAPPSGEIASIPSGKLFLSRSLLSPKGALECLYNDSALSIKPTSTPHCYQLAVTRAYQEGELGAEFADGNDSEDDLEALDEHAANADERLFFLSPELHVRLHLKHDGTQVLRWDDVSGDSGDCYEFIVDEDIRGADVASFMFLVYRCLYEQVHEKSAADVPKEELRAEFSQHVSPVNSPQASLELLRSHSARSVADENRAPRSGVARVRSYAVDLSGNSVPSCSRGSAIELPRGAPLDRSRGPALDPRSSGLEPRSFSLEPHVSGLEPQSPNRPPRSSSYSEQQRSRSQQQRSQSYSERLPRSPSAEKPALVYFHKALLLTGTVICRYNVELRIFDKDSEAFVLLTPDAEVAIIKNDQDIYMLLSPTTDYAFAAPLLRKEWLKFYQEYSGLALTYRPAGSRAKEIRLFMKFASTHQFESFRNEYLTAMFKNVVQQQGDAANAQQLVDGLRAVKLSSSDLPFGRQSGAAGPEVGGDNLQKATSLSALTSSDHWQNDQRAPAPASGRSSDIFLGAFRKTEDGIVLLSEITSIEDSHGNRHDSALNLQDLRAQTFVLRDPQA
ncbi:VID27-domain-containing protein [Metschnikowia bicuspidata]|uniref:VID27-domain-containing protein n=1 Tax=Metschnikowia bicuspidata TaxID=27322 RepID=A0A4P9ZHF9_9ASCO|nr:VID27-domain-containing protein [Metschnikowia bicuspidata]